MNLRRLQLAALACVVVVGSISPAEAERRRTRARASSPPVVRSEGGNCSCASRRVCTGPRGGRYCITSGGNKRYGL